MVKNAAIGSLHNQPHGAERTPDKLHDECHASDTIYTIHKPLLDARPLSSCMETSFVPLLHSQAMDRYFFRLLFILHTSWQREVTVDQARWMIVGSNLFGCARSGLIMMHSCHVPTAHYSTQPNPTGQLDSLLSAHVTSPFSAATYDRGSDGARTLKIETLSRKNGPVQKTKHPGNGRCSSIWES